MRANQQIKLIFAMVSILTASTSFASVDGVYIGGQLGWGHIHNNGISQSDLTTAVESSPAVLPDPITVLTFSNSEDTSGWAGRVYAGYKFNCHWALELGWTRFNDMDISADTTAVADGSAVTASASGDVKTSAVDLVAKTMLPLRNGFSVYAKLGVAYLTAKKGYNVSVVNDGISGPVSVSNTQHRWCPTFGLGVAYDFTPNVIADLAWNRIQRVGGSSNIAGSTDFVGLGVGYYFG